MEQARQSLLSQIVLATTAVIGLTVFFFYGPTFYFISASLEQNSRYKLELAGLKLEKELAKYQSLPLEQVPLEQLCSTSELRKAKVALVDLKSKKVLTLSFSPREIEEIQKKAVPGKPFCWKDQLALSLPLSPHRSFFISLPRRDFQPFYGHLFFLALFIILAILVSGGFMIYVLYRIVLRPLEDLIVANLGTLEGKPEYLLIPPANIPKNEIGQTMSQRNRLILKLKEFQEKIEDQNEELRKKQVELEKWSQELERRVEEKTQELKRAEERLIQAEKLAALGKLASGIAHEVNNPLASIAVYAEDMIETLEEGGNLSPEERKEFIHSLSIIESQAYRLKELTRKLLNFARETEIQLEEVQINGVIEETLALFQLQPRREVILETRLEPSLPPVWTDRSKVQQILMNLLDNGVYAVQGGGKIIVSTRKTPQGVQIVVEDTGAGIPEEIQSKIFDPFFTTKPVGQGTGLGLSICYGLARKLKGALEFMSREGQGSTFILTLPFVAPSQEEEEGTPIFTTGKKEFL